MPGRYLIPLAPFLLIGILCVLFLFFFLRVEHQMRTSNLHAKRRLAERESAASELKGQIEELSARILDAEERTGVLVPPMPPKSGLNLNKRSQAIRMSRRGEPAGKIAAALNLPQREVELLLKVYSRVVYTSTEVNS